jgi:hypothetical protein
MMKINPDHRSIISLVNVLRKLCSFFKALYVNNKDEIGRITYGTASQLRSSVIGIGKKTYLIGSCQNRAKEDRQEDLLGKLKI